MIGWRRRRDGFEWREYVRTTILVRRKNRRDRIVRAGNAAVDGLKAAGERGAAAGAIGAQAVGHAAKVAGHQGVVMGLAGADALGRGAKAAGRQGFAIGAAGVRAADEGIRAGVPVALEALQAFARKALAWLAIAWAALRSLAINVADVSAPRITAGWQRLAPLFAWLRKPGVTTVLALVAGVAFVGSVRRIAANGFDSDIFVALVIGTVIACALLAAWLEDGLPPWLSEPLHGIGRGVARGADSLAGLLSDLGPSRATRARGGAVAAVLVVAIGAGWLVWRAAAALPSLVGGGAARLEGRAIALSGDTLRVAGTTVALSGIEAPVEGQTCATDDARSWRCDAAAKSALARLLRSASVACSLSGTDDLGRKVGTCREGETDIAAELVRNGDVFAQTGFFSSYGSLENAAREAKVGIWRGEAARPSDYRSQKWEEAKREAPEGCPIKGNVMHGRRVYVLPWAQGYERVKVSSSRGERWFCSEAEARAAGWRRLEQS
jgi:endonuclease YncB( thermonuclease family)